MISPIAPLFFLITSLLSIILIIVGQVLSPKTPYTEKNSPYECGFAPINSPRLPFSFRFFLVAILFLIFDLEIAILLIFPFSLNLINPGLTSTVNSLFLIILAGGLYYEWSQGGLEWAED
uniref:NADH-ubiquinone oxidoreductase chain 3 n=1 Tax=Amphiura sinicola TaxID=2705302 RepID=A0A6C0FFJ7_9ECHI|nr:NADH dehydrogenase subunit 3 [Amphiura sinicola]QHT54214.1 NADH dehydrogenase subunit 3 [Amphiura sinicola]